VVRTVLIVDDNALLRRSLRFCIELHTDWRVCGEAENGRIALEKVEELRPTMVILDFQMPVMNGLDAARLIIRGAPYTVMIMFTMHSSEYLLKEAHAVGIRHVVSKATGFADCLLPLFRKLSEQSSKLRKP
jgi:DNA-binding NarL/FixJ family response regulator